MSILRKGPLLQGRNEFEQYLINQIGFEAILHGNHNKLYDLQNGINSYEERVAFLEEFSNEQKEIFCKYKNRVQNNKRRLTKSIQNEIDLLNIKFEELTNQSKVLLMKIKKIDIEKEKRNKLLQKQEKHLKEQHDSGYIYGNDIIASNAIMRLQQKYPQMIDWYTRQVSNIINTINTYQIQLDKHAINLTEVSEQIKSLKDASIILKKKKKDEFYQTKSELSDLEAKISDLKYERERLDDRIGKMKNHHKALISSITLLMNRFTMVDCRIDHSMNAVFLLHNHGHCFEEGKMDDWELIHNQEMVIQNEKRKKLLNNDINQILSQKEGLIQMKNIIVQENSQLFYRIEELEKMKNDLDLEIGEISFNESDNTNSPPTQHMCSWSDPLFDKRLIEVDFESLDQIRYENSLKMLIEDDMFSIECLNNDIEEISQKINNIQEKQLATLLKHKEIIAEDEKESHGHVSIVPVLKRRIKCLENMVQTMKTRISEKKFRNNLFNIASGINPSFDRFEAIISDEIRKWKTSSCDSLSQLQKWYSALFDK